MATAPVKPPLHNFPLSFLKWGSKNHTNTNHRYRRPVSAEPEPTASDDHNDSEPDRPHHTNRVGSRTARHRFSLTSCSEKLPKLPQPQNSERESEDSEGDVKAATAGAEEAEVQKPWNLRPRRAPASAAMTFKANNTGANCELHEPEGPNPKQSEQPAPKSMRLRGLAEGPSMEKKEKRKFWIALSKDEIEEDIFVMTGSRPARRPKKRPKNVQKQLDVYGWWGLPLMLIGVLILRLRSRRLCYFFKAGKRKRLHLWPGNLNLRLPYIVGGRVALFANPFSILGLLTACFLVLEELLGSIELQRKAAF